jgi:hypothetical protein
MNLSRFSLAAVVLAIAPSVAMADFTDQAPEYVDLVPLDQLITAGVSACGAQSTMQVPMIDWSGDFPTVHANGGATPTLTACLRCLALTPTCMCRMTLCNRQLTTSTVTAHLCV